MTRVVKQPEVFLVSKPSIDWVQIYEYLKKVAERTDTPADEWGPGNWESDGDNLVEIGGRFCYRSWVPGANVNVTRIRDNQQEYLGNVLASGHGSVLEHANYSYIFDDVSRVFTHEMVRHRAGVAVSQESLRFVRLTDIPFWFPEWAREDQELMERSIELLWDMEVHQTWMTRHFKLDDENVPFHEKKHKTSFMRRFAPEGVATGMLCTINVRALRHIIYMRTSMAAEEEIRIVWDQVAKLALEATPNLMQDYHPNENHEWVPEFMKV